MTWEKAFHFGGLSVLLFRPAPNYLGHLNLEIMFAAATARRGRSWLYLCEPRSVANRTPFDLDIPDLRRFPPIGLLDRIFNWVADRDEAAKLDLKRLARDNMRLQLGLPLDGWLLEWEYLARIRVAMWRLRRAERRLARRLRVAGALTKPRRLNVPPVATGSETIDQLKKEKKEHRRVAKLIEKEHQRVAKLIEKEHRHVVKLIEGYRENFVRTCVHNPLDIRTFWSWPLYERKQRWRQRLGKFTVAGQGPYYFKRRLIAETAPFRFRDADRDRLANLTRNLGISPSAKLITLHIRESGFKRGFETQDKGIASGRDRDRIRDDSTRNATIENYCSAIRYLTEAGYTIARIGDSSMTPLSLPSVVDIATLRERDPALDYYCVSRSDFFIACDSGPWTISWMMGTPVLVLNATHAVPAWPISKRDLVVPKYVREIATGRFLTLRETCEPSQTEHFRAVSLYDYLELTPPDILAAVREMEERVQATIAPNPTALQEAYRRMYLEMSTSDTVSKYFLKWGPHDGFLGDGAIAQFVAERDAAIGWQPPIDATGKMPEHDLAVENTSVPATTTPQRGQAP